MYQGSKFLDIISRGARLLDISLAQTALPLFEQYRLCLTSWNRRYNITSLHDPTDIAVLHFLDSLAVLKILPPAACSLLDIGAGTGFPGIAVKIAQPNIALSLLDPDPKKIVFLKQLVGELRITDVRFLSCRIEDLPPTSFHGSFDVVLTRALNLDSQRLRKIPSIVRKSGIFIRMLGPRSLGTHINIPAFRLAASWAGYLPFLAVYRRLVGYAPL